MKISIVNACIKPPSAKSKQHLQMYLGELLEVCSQDAIRRNIDIKSFLHWIKPAVLHDQYLQIKNEGEVNTSGYITWAFVNDKTLQRYIQGARFVLHPSEWNEGQHLIVVDFCSIGDPRRFFKKALRQAKVLTEAGVASITVCTRDKMGNPVKSHHIYVKNIHAQ